MGDIEDAHLHRASTPDQHRHPGIVPLHTIERAVIDIAREHGTLSALVVADAALHLGLASLDTLQATVRACTGWPGVRAAREAIDVTDARAESPLETASRYLLRGLVPRPELQVDIYDEHGRFLGRSDFLWPDIGVVGEADGMEKYDGRDELALTKEKVRQGDFEDAGLVVVRWGRDDLRQLTRLVDRLHRGFDRARNRTQPRRWTIEPRRRTA